MISVQQHQMMTVHQSYPLNASPSLEHIRQAFITPQERFFVRNHGTVPYVNVQRYRLSVTGMAEAPLEFSLNELRSCFPATTITATLQCAGNRRNELSAVQPIPGELP